MHASEGFADGILTGVPKVLQVHATDTLAALAIRYNTTVRNSTGNNARI